MIDHEEFENLKQAIELAKSVGAKRLKVDGFEVEFFEKPHAPVIALPNPEDIFPKGSDLDQMPSDEELLMWSTDSYDEMTESREEAKKPEQAP